MLYFTGEVVEDYDDLEEEDEDDTEDEVIYYTILYYRLKGSVIFCCWESSNECNFTVG